MRPKAMCCMIRKKPATCDSCGGPAWHINAVRTIRMPVPDLKGMTIEVPLAVSCQDAWQENLGARMATLAKARHYFPQYCFDMEESQ